MCLVIILLGEDGRSCKSSLRLNRSKGATWTLCGLVTSLKGHPGVGEDEIDMVAGQDVSEALEELWVIAFCTHAYV